MRFIGDLGGGKAIQSKGVKWPSSLSSDLSLLPPSVSCRVGPWEFAIFACNSGIHSHVGVDRLILATC